MSTQTPRDLSKSKYAAQSREVLALMNQLAVLGAQADLDLPRIVVVGNQSAGKSSLVEAISGITVPRDAGTCTRCPMECRLSSSDKEWACKVSIRWGYSPTGAANSEILEVPFGEVIQDKSQVELRLRQAQMAILSPRVNTLQFLSFGANELKEKTKGVLSLPFSKNVVCVDLEGPDLPNLSFIDLPGIIQNADDSVIKLVEDMVTSYIQGNCLILVTLPMTDDIENQKALRLANRADPEGRRTIGVITKPDILTAGSTQTRNLWLEVIEGKRHQLKHGYYCTRQPDDDERSKNITPSEARESEAMFFSQNEPWKGSKHRSRFGTGNLVNMLSTLLVQIINESLPQIKSETTSRLLACDEALSRLPKPMGMDPSTHMLQLITAFCADINLCTFGSGSETGQLIQQHRNAYADFKVEIRKSAPNFQPFANASSAQAYEKQWYNFLRQLDLSVPDEREPFYLEDMRKHIEKSITRELPNNVPFEAKKTLIQSFQSSWTASVNKCFERVVKVTSDVLSNCVEFHFSQYAALQTHLRSFILSELLKNHQEICFTLLQTILEAELTPFTQNFHYLDSTTDKWLSASKEVRAGKLPQDLADERRLFKPQLTAGKTVVAKGGEEGKTNEEEKAEETRSFNFPRPMERSSTAQPAAKVARVSSPFGIGVYKAEQDHRRAPTNTFQTSLGEETAKVATSPNIFTFGPPAKVEQNEIRAPTTADQSPADPELVRNALAALAQIGYTGITQADLGRLIPADEYQRELQVMAEVRAYFQVAYKRVTDIIPSLIDLKFFKALAKDMQSFLIYKMELGSSSASARNARLLAEDPNMIAYREELTERRKRLESVAAELKKYGI